MEESAARVWLKKVQRMLWARPRSGPLSSGKRVPKFFWQGFLSDFTTCALRSLRPTPYLLVSFSLVSYLQFPVSLPF